MRVIRSGRSMWPSATGVAVLLAAAVVLSSPLAEAQSQTAPPASLRLLASEPGVTYHLQTGTSQAVAYGGGMTAVAFAASYDRLCTAPCDTELPVGNHVLALSLDHSPPVETLEPVIIQGPSELRGSYESRAGLRIAGLLTLLGGGGAGLGLGLVGLLRTEESCDSSGFCLDEMSPNWALAITGASIELASVIVGMILMRQPDRADIDVLPAAS